MPASTDEKNFYVCNGKEFLRVEKSGTLSANLCWLEIAATAGGASWHSIIVGNETPSINETLGDEGGAFNAKSINSEWYDISFRKLQGKPSAKGIYIKHRRKFVIK